PTSRYRSPTMNVPDLVSGKSPGIWFIGLSRRPSQDGLGGANQDLLLLQDSPSAAVWIKCYRSGTQTEVVSTTAPGGCVLRTRNIPAGIGRARVKTCSFALDMRSDPGSASRGFCSNSVEPWTTLRLPFGSHGRYGTRKHAPLHLVER